MKLYSIPQNGNSAIDFTINILFLLSEPLTTA